jgi:sarcosine oxidase subunit beta
VAAVGPGSGRTRDVEVVVVGGGVMGASTAYHLARAGVTDVVLLEAADLASGSSGKPLGGVRAQFSDRANVELGARSLAAFRAFGDEVGVDIGLRPVGYLFVLRAAGDVAPFEAGVAVQNELGVGTRLVDAAEAVALCPYLDPGVVVAASWSPEDGFARPNDVVRGYAAAAERLGAVVRTGARVVGIDVAGDLATVTTADGERWTAPAVVCTAGVWSGEVAALAGVDLPIRPLRREIAFTGPSLPPTAAPPARAEGVPFTIDYSTTAYFHPAEDGGLLLGWSDPDQPEGFDRSVSTGWHEGLRAALRVVAPSLADVPLGRGWAGLYEVTPDYNALVGQTTAPGFRFLYAAGFSGHGFLQGPAVGECLRDLYLGVPPPVDVSVFDASRFGAGKPRRELGIV